jgi:hypothetical protein
METTNFDERKSIQTIQEMLLVSKRKFQSDGILFIVWGWIMTIHYMVSYVLGYSNLSTQLKNGIKYFTIGLIILGFAFTLYYIFKLRKKVQTYIGISLRYVWVGMFFSLVLVNVIQFRVLQEINFELQHPIFMVIIAFATVVTGGILRYQLIVYGGISFALLALLSSRLPLESQLLMESIAWLIAFVVPGHMLYSKRKS